MATNWTEPKGDELAKVLSRLILEPANENLSEDQPAKEGAKVDLASDNRRDGLLALVVEEFRGAIRCARRFPLSLTEGTVPAEAKIHVLNKTAFELATSVLNLKTVIITERGASMPFQVHYQKAVDYLAALKAGAPVTLPSDPTGVDYTSAVDADTNPAICGVNGGDIVGAQDLSTE